MVAAEHATVLLQPMAYDFDAAMVAEGRQSVYGTFKAVESVGFTVESRHLESLVVFISTVIAFCHYLSP